MHSPSQLLLDLPKFGSHAVAPGLPMNQELTTTRFATDEHKPEEVEGLRFTETPRLSIGRCMAPKLDYPGLFRM